jgi:hypothetical protein
MTHPIFITPFVLLSSCLMLAAALAPSFSIAA